MHKEEVVFLHFEFGDPLCFINEADFRMRQLSNMSQNEVDFRMRQNEPGLRFLQNEEDLRIRQIEAGFENDSRLSMLICPDINIAGKSG